MKKDIKRIAIIGNAGSGKSTFALKLHKAIKVPVYHLDRYFWKPNWAQPVPEEYKIIHDKLCDQDEWIIEGMNLRVLEYRIQKADVVIFLDVARFTCLWRVIRRAVAHYGKERPTGPELCPERLNRAFLKFLAWIWQFNTSYKPKILALLDTYANSKEIYVIKTARDMNAFLEKLST